MYTSKVGQSFIVQPELCVKSDKFYASICLLNCLLSRTTQAAMVDVGMADSSQSKFMMSCLSKGASSLNDSGQKVETLRSF